MTREHPSGHRPQRLRDEDNRVVCLACSFVFSDPTRSELRELARTWRGAVPVGTRARAWLDQQAGSGVTV